MINKLAKFLLVATFGARPQGPESAMPKSSDISHVRP